MKKAAKICFLTGEKSGDDLAAPVIDSIKSMRPLTKIYGVCGPKMRKLGVIEIGAMENFQTLLPYSLTRLPFMYWHFKKICDEIMRLDPEVVVCVDASTLSLQLAERMRSMGYTGRLIKYVSPSLLWKDEARIEKLESSFDHLIALFPHEEEHLRKKKIPTAFLGHPLIFDNEAHDNSQAVCTMFPGSRPFLIENSVRAQAKVGDLLKRRFPRLGLQISCASPELEVLIKKGLSHFDKRTRSHFAIVPTHDDHVKNAIIANTTAAMAIPGTVNLSLANYGVPSLIAYPIPRWMRYVAQKKLKRESKNHSLVNQIQQSTVFPELLLTVPFSVNKAVERMSALLWDENLRKHIRNQCQSVSMKLYNPHHVKDVTTVILAHSDARAKT